MVEVAFQFLSHGPRVDHGVHLLWTTIPCSQVMINILEAYLKPLHSEFQRWICGFLLEKWSDNLLYCESSCVYLGNCGVLVLVLRDEVDYADGQRVHRADDVHQIESGSLIC